MTGGVHNFDAIDVFIYLFSAGGVPRCFLSMLVVWVMAPCSSRQVHTALNLGDQQRRGMLEPAYWNFTCKPILTDKRDFLILINTLKCYEPDKRYAIMRVINSITAITWITLRAERFKTDLCFFRFMDLSCFILSF